MATITTVTEYLNLIKGIEIKHNIFFRGHSDDSYDLNPGIYRKVKGDKTLIEYEDQILREVISRSPQEFVGKNTLETLALLQHYDAPTRVLDLTENALAALYFAVSSKSSMDNQGEVIVFDIPDKSVCHYNSDRITILANIAKCDKDFTYHPELVPVYRNKILELEKKKISKSSIGYMFNGNISDFFHVHAKNVEKMFAEDDRFELENFDKNLEILKQQYNAKYEKLTDKDTIDFENIYIDFLINILNVVVNLSIANCNQKFFGKLLHNIREDKSYFDAIIDPEDISQVFAIRPKLDNPRIVRQQGAFLIFGVKQVQFPGFGDYKPIALLNKEWVIKGFGEERILIDKDSKSNILKELEQLGITQSTLFPEVDKVADFVKQKFSEKL